MVHSQCPSLSMAYTQEKQLPPCDLLRKMLSTPFIMAHVQNSVLLPGIVRSRQMGQARPRCWRLRLQRAGWLW